jgi:8-amino-7-oxononanoate synthase
MYGDVAKLTELADLAMKHHAMLMIDDAHGIGVLGEHGKGASHYFAISGKHNTCVTVPLGKALGSMGAIVYGHADIIESLLQFARTYRYSTALPPAICAATRAALRILQRENWRQAKLHDLCRFFIEETIKRNLPLITKEVTPIKSILIGENRKALQIQQKLMEKRLFVSCIRPPTVPNGHALLRISLTCNHEERHLVYLLDQLAALCS